MTSLNKGIGILGGSFDPIHLGHSKSAEVVALALELDKVLLIPAYISPLKTTPDLVPHASARQRADMVEIVCNQHSIFLCDTREIKRAGHSYTVDTLKELKNEYPNQALHFIIGMDSLITFTQWHRYEDILKLCHLIVNTRPNHSIDLLDEQTKVLLNKYQTTDKKQLRNQESGKIYLADPHYYDISSTQIRQDISEQKSTNKQLIPEISDFIHKNKLYR